MIQENKIPPRRTSLSISASANQLLEIYMKFRISSSKVRAIMEIMQAQALGTDCFGHGEGVVALSISKTREATIPQKGERRRTTIVSLRKEEDIERVLEAARAQSVGISRAASDSIMAVLSRGVTA